MIQADVRRSNTAPGSSLRAEVWRAVIAEDDSASRILLQSLLEKWGYSVTVVEDGEAALAELCRNDAPDIAVLDWMMPKRSGVEVVAELQRSGRAPLPYVILLTAKGQKADMIEALDKGADDYLTKPFDFGELAARLRVAQRTLRTQRELIRAREQIREQATLDTSTGAFNRATILELLARDSEARRPRAPLLCAVDGYRDLEALHGVRAMEGLVRALVERVRGVHAGLRVGRYATEQLLVLLPAEDAAGAPAIAERIRHEVALQPIDIGFTRVPVTISGGMTLCGAESTHGAEWLLYCADTALFAARSGGDQIEVFELADGDGGSLAAAREVV